MHKRIDCIRLHELNIKVEVTRTASDIRLYDIVYKRQFI